MHDAAILQIGAAFQDQPAEIPAQRSARPHIAAGPDDDIAVSQLLKRLRQMSNIQSWTVGSYDHDAFCTFGECRRHGRIHPLSQRTFRLRQIDRLSSKLRAELLFIAARVSHFNITVMGFRPMTDDAECVTNQTPMQRRRTIRSQSRNQSRLGSSRFRKTSHHDNSISTHRIRWDHVWFTINCT